MQTIVAWLETIEREAGRLYLAAAGRFAADRPFAAFLEKLAAEEQWHLELLRSLAAGGKPLLGSALLGLDETTGANISSLFSAASARLAAGEMSRGAMLETIAAAEFSEWNDIFLYVLHLLKENSREYRAAVAEVERHKEDILDFFAGEPDGGRYLETVWHLPAVADTRILVVEKQEALGRLLRGILATVGEVELVESGPEGLRRIENGRFDVILSDINMQAMSSLDFYARVVSSDPEMKDRFVFFAGGSLQEGLPADGATLLSAPVMIHHIRRVVAGIAHRSRVFH